MMRRPHLSHFRWWFVPLWAGGIVVGAVFLAALLVAGFVVAGKGPHLLWLIERRMNSGLLQQQAVPVGQLEATIPEDWQRCRIGSLEVSLPVDRIQDVEVQGEDSALSGVMVHFRDDGQRLFVWLPRDATSDLDAWRKEWAATAPRPINESPARFQALLYETSANEFRWSMSAEEVQWLRWRLAMKYFSQGFEIERVETLFTPEVEALLKLRGHSAWFEWHSVDQRAGGMLILGQQAESGDLSWARPICASLMFTGEVYPKKIPKETLEQIAKELRGQLQIPSQR